MEFGGCCDPFRDGASQETPGAFPPDTGGAAGAGGGICSPSCRPARFKVPGGSAEVAHAARRRWACLGVSRVWVLMPRLERVGGEADLSCAFVSLFEYRMRVEL